MANPRFFWIGEETEVFAAKELQQLVDDAGGCGSGIGCMRGDRLFDESGDPLEWGEVDAFERTTIREGEDGSGGTFTGTYLDIYLLSGRAFELPVLLFSQYN